MISTSLKFKVAAYVIAFFNLSAAFADSAWHVTKRINVKSAKHGVISTEYPQLTAKVGPAHALLNANIRKEAHRMRCDVNTVPGHPPMDYTSQIRLQAITHDFVSLVAREDFDCGGAHPDNSIETFVYDRWTGTSVDVTGEFGWKDPKGNWSDKDSARYEAFQNKMATFLAARIPIEAAKCLKDAVGADDPKDEITHMSLTFGLKRGRVVVYAEPAHVIAVCGFEVEVPYSDIHGLLNKNSILHHWLR